MKQQIENLEGENLILIDSNLNYQQKQTNFQKEINFLRLYF